MEEEEEEEERRFVALFEEERKTGRTGLKLKMSKALWRASLCISLK